MPRPINKRTIHTPPRVKGFIPVDHISMEFDPIRISIEEYETVKLLDYEGLSQQEAAKVMNVSRPTITRIYENARRVISKGLVEGRQIVIDGGINSYVGEWYYCKNCYSRFNNPKDEEITDCPLCNNQNIFLMEN